MASNNGSLILTTLNNKRIDSVLDFGEDDDGLRESDLEQNMLEWDFLEMEKRTIKQFSSPIQLLESDLIVVEERDDLEQFVDLPPETTQSPRELSSSSTSSSSSSLSLTKNSSAPLQGVPSPSLFKRFTNIFSRQTSLLPPPPLIPIPTSTIENQPDLSSTEATITAAHLSRTKINDYVDIPEVDFYGAEFQSTETKESLSVRRELEELEVKGLVAGEEAQSNIESRKEIGKVFVEAIKKIQQDPRRNSLTDDSVSSVSEFVCAEQVNDGNVAKPAKDVGAKPKVTKKWLVPVNMDDLEEMFGVGIKERQGVSGWKIDQLELAELFEEEVGVFCPVSLACSILVFAFEFKLTNLLEY